MVGPATPSKRLYCIVGIRSNGSRVVMGNGLALDEARRMRDAIFEANVFDGVHVEMDHREQSSESDPPGSE